VPASATQLGFVHSALERFWVGMTPLVTDVPDDQWRSSFTTALMEIMSNVFQYAYPSCPGVVAIRLASYHDRARACVVDRGVAFDALLESAQIPDVETLAEGGYGLALARACLDRLDYCRTADGHNRWSLEKRFRSQSADV
jgi:anti-sigma regulatory factor (Ser/Thr protein kinase)